MFCSMGLPEKPIALSPEQVAELNQKLSAMRHNINNQLTLIIAATELIRRKPELAAKYLENIGQQPERIVAELRNFSDIFEAALKIGREPLAEPTG